MAKKQPLIIKIPEQKDQLSSNRSTQPIYELSTNVIDVAPSSVALPSEADTLSESLRELAVRFIGTRRRIGEALLEACHYMSKARDAAEEGQWYLFLQVTGTSPDSAATLINIHYRAAQYPAFAERIRSGWLSQTVAGELAKPSTPPSLIEQMLEREAPPRVADVKRARRSPPSAREEHHEHVDNPNCSGSSKPQAHLAEPLEGGRGAFAIEPLPITSQLHEVAVSLEAIASQESPIRIDEPLLTILERIEQATKEIRQRLSGL